MPDQLVFAGYPEVAVYDNPSEKSSERRTVANLLWGHPLKELESQANWVKVSYGQPYEKTKEPREGWVRRKSIIDKPILQLIFIDCGQGDSCWIRTPQGKNILLDAGKSNNTVRFINFMMKSSHYFSAPKFDCGIISHSDSDHYGGYDSLFSKGIGFGRIYHNGIVDRSGEGLDTLGKCDSDLVIDTVPDKASFRALCDSVSEKSYYMRVLDKGCNLGLIDNSNIRMLCADDQKLDIGDPDVDIEVLGPVTKPGPNNKPCLPLFHEDDSPSAGKTKNGNSVVLRLSYGNIRIMLPGDLNEEAHRYLLDCYKGSDANLLRADVMKISHHGSADFAPEFLDEVNALINIISSGDNESYGHPCPDTLGVLGLHSRAPRPSIFCTELARSAVEWPVKPAAVKSKYRDLREELDKTSDEKKRKSLFKEIDNLIYEMPDRDIGTYGSINLRTDGEKILVAQMSESGGGKDKKGNWKARKWLKFRFEQADGSLKLIS